MIFFFIRIMIKLLKYRVECIVCLAE